HRTSGRGDGHRDPVARGQDDHPHVPLRPGLALVRARLYPRGMSPVEIQVQPTPNINALKFVLDRRLTEGKSQTFRSADEAASAPLARALLGIPGVIQVFFLNDFITVTRKPESPWEKIADQVEATIRGHFGA
ncbi:MAG TPA: NifU N-terminal domain-containing protein, partial [bacterium]|nr:NifU N-terminal domain-containing protein [bacterium]